MTQLRRYTIHAVDELRRGIPGRLDWYYAPRGNPPPVAPGGWRETRLASPNLSNLVINPVRPSRTDDTNALVVYEALSELTPHQASDERLWVYLCHQEHPQYVAGRWLGDRPADDDEAVRDVRNHFFAVDNRALIRDNGLSRLWWLGKIASDVAPEDPAQFLAILLHRQDVRSALIERPFLSTNRRVLRVIYEEMRRHWENGGKLFEREVFRSWMRALNRRGGVILLDALPDKPLAVLVREEADRALGA